MNRGQNMVRDNKRFLFFLLAALSVTALLLLLLPGRQASAGARPVTGSGVALPLPTEGTEPLPQGAVIDTLLTNMANPVALAFDPQGRLFYTEKDTGRVRLFQNGTLQASPVITFSVDNCTERGLLGLAIDPNFSANHYIYVYYTE